MKRNIYSFNNEGEKIFEGTTEINEFPYFTKSAIAIYKINSLPDKEEISICDGDIESVAINMGPAYDGEAALMNAISKGNEVATPEEWNNAVYSLRKHLATVTVTVIEAVSVEGREG